jgi:hypothetical protein
MTRRNRSDRQHRAYKTSNGFQVAEVVLALFSILLVACCEAVRLSILLYISPGTNFRSSRDVLRKTGIRGRALEELTILVIEDERAVQAVVDEALCDGGMSRLSHRQGKRQSRFCGRG